MIGEVRRQIEQLVAQRERLSRLVSLATILVIILATQGAVADIMPILVQRAGTYQSAPPM